MEDPEQRSESRIAFEKVEHLLNKAKNNIMQIGQLGQTRDYIQDALSTCDQIDANLSTSLKPLISNVRKHIDSDRPKNTIEIDIDTALGEIENLRPSL